MNLVSRHYNFDSAHTVLYNANNGKRGKCSHRHGHSYLLESTFSYTEDTTEDHLGYAIDFGEIKRVFCNFIDEYIDHGYIANPKDTIIDFLKSENSKLYIMTLGNPSAENIAKELFYIGNYLLKDRGLEMYKVKLYETPNCYVECFNISTKEEDMLSNNSELQQVLSQWKADKGIMEYDIRKAKNA